MQSLELWSVSKRFGATVALDDARFDLRAGEVHALLGENGAGKTTLVRVLYGLVRPDAGELRIDGERVALAGPRDALARGVGLVHQHFMGVPELSVAENLALGEAGSFLLSRAELARGARALCAEYGLDVDVERPAGSLSVGEQQRLEIARALARGARALILDEPTAVLAPSEVDGLLALLSDLRGQGRGIVFISHRLEEVTALCDRVTVLRRGRTVESRTTSGLDARELGRLMVGEDPAPPGRPVGRPTGAVGLRTRGLRCGMLRGLDLDVHCGEVFAIGGIDGNGQDELESLLAGVRRPDAGEVEVARPPLGLLPGDRHRTGLVLELALEENLVLRDTVGSQTPKPGSATGGAATREASILPAFRFGIVRRRAVRAQAESAIAALGIKGSPAAAASSLSGGNQQKVCVARALRHAPGVVVAVNPTRGLDVGATAAVRERLRAEVRRGTAVLLVSTDLDEVLELGDRVAVLFRGELQPVEPDRRTRARIGELMLGRGAS